MNPVQAIIENTPRAGPSMTIDELACLLSDEAKEYLQPMAEAAAQLTRQRFGHTMRLFIPLYLSNLCANDCSYCGFSMSNAIKRTTLSMTALEQECLALKAQGFDSVLLVAGEHERKVGMPYFRQAMAVVRRFFSHIALEVQPLASEDYAELRSLGLAAVYVYQETYQPEAYAAHHLRGRKTDMQWRLQAPARVAAAGVDKIGLGILLGLADWRTDALACARHLRQLQQHYWRSRYSLAFPRLRPCAGGIQSQHLVDDKTLLQLICAFRLFEPNLELVLSTRESAGLRDHLIPLGITHISAGSKTQPGGYAEDSIALEQFATSDPRSASQMASNLLQRGFEPVWKDWQAEFS
ncbi:2-iminoacetate synthase ThiH [Aliidiomarina sedimenti]|uniref:2-iminoacetate synthase ThiH n=1 Tax=Aliidiomarina sedimenti TaxID=1933879 RepID=A0ABY0BYB3_9GAMM|nr:2-iminoacetate synthase ThiH [Aliidiomarina sedimenti]RUO29267.1 2-iminoacetate synthase ThiH [Aliidiomarina sedimenti]